MMNGKKVVSFDKLVRSASNHVIPEDEIYAHHQANPRGSSVNIRPDKYGNARSLFGTSKTAYGHPDEHFQTSAERKIATNEHQQGPDYHRRIRNSAEYANDTWNMTHKTSLGAWFSNNKETIFLTAAVLIAAGFAFCANGTAKRKSKGKLKGNKTRANKTRANKTRANKTRAKKTRAKKTRAKR